MTGVNSNEAYKFVLSCFKVAGLFSKIEDRNLFYNLYQILVTCMFTIFYPISFLINLFTLQRLSTLLSNLSVGLNLISSTVKALTIFLLRRSFFEIAEVVQELDKRLLDDDVKKRVNDITKQCQWISLGYLGTYFVALGMFAVSSLVTMEHLIFPTWFPFDWRYSRLNFAVAFFYQFISACYQIVQLSAYDTYPTIYIKILTCHLKALTSRIQKIGCEPNKSKQQNYGELVSCVQNHVLILKYLDIVKRVISLTIFNQFIVAAFVLCTTTAYVVLLNEGFLDNITASFYLIVLILQVLPCCYYVEEFMTESNFLTTAIYNSDWVNQDPKFKRVLIIFMQRTQKENVIFAGSLIQVSLVTFLRMVKFSYSMFAILGQMKG